MISRQDNNFQDRKGITTFGQLILPLTIVIALGLMFFSVRLFFYTPMNPERDNVMEEESKQIKEIIKDKQEKKTAEAKNNGAYSQDKKGAVVQQGKDDKAVGNAKAKEEYVSINPAKPIKTSTSKKITNESAVIARKTAKQEDKITQPVATKKEAKGEKQAVKTAKENSDKKAEKTQTSQKAKSTKTEKQAQSASTAKVKRWDIQIGVFSDKKNAEQLMQKAKSEGYKVYIEEETVKNASCYKIRVQGATDKEKTEKLLKDLSSKGYPVYAVAVE